MDHIIDHGTSLSSHAQDARSEKLQSDSVDVEKEAGSASGGEDKSQTVYDWSGPEDRDHPFNWPFHKKLAVSLGVLGSAMIATIASGMFGSGSKQVEKEFGVGSDVSVLGTSLFVLGFFFGPPFWGPLSEKFGRKAVMLGGLAGCCTASLMSALGQNLQTILLGRFFAGVFGAGPLAAIGGAATDNYKAVSRGVNLTAVVGMAFGGPLVAPVIGNFMIQSNLSWRWNMWVIIIAGLVVFLIFVLALPESYAPVVLQNKTKKLRKSTGDMTIKCKLDLESTNITLLCQVYLVRPWILFFTEPILIFITIYQAFVYGIVYLFCSSYPIVFHDYRGWELGLSALPLFSVVVGFFLGMGVTIYYTKNTFARKLADNDGVVIPEDRLPLMIYGAFILPIGFFWFAWTSNRSIPWPSVVVSGVIIGLGMFLVWIHCFLYTTDVYLPVANSAMASNQMVRALFGASFPLFASKMYHQLGTAWATSLLGFISILMIPVPVVFYLYGARIRSWSRNTISVGV